MATFLAKGGARRPAPNRRAPKYHAALATCSQPYDGYTDPLIRMLDVAQAYTHRIDWSTLNQARAALAATSACDEGAEAKLRLA